LFEDAQKLTKRSPAEQYAPESRID